MTAFERYRLRIGTLVPGLPEEIVETVATWALDCDRQYEHLGRATGATLNCNHDPAITDDGLLAAVNFLGWYKSRRKNP